MDISDPYCHTSTIAVECAAEAALAYLADGLKQGEWTLGSLDRKRLNEDLYSGTSLFDGSTLYVRIRPDAENFMIFYDIGRDPDELVPRNVIRVVPGPVVGRSAACCLVTLMTWRAQGTSDEQWLRTSVSHETEMFIIKARLENNKPDNRG